MTHKIIAFVDADSVEFQHVSLTEAMSEEETSTHPDDQRPTSASPTEPPLANGECPAGEGGSAPSVPSRSEDAGVKRPMDEEEVEAPEMPDCKRWKSDANERKEQDQKEEELLKEEDEEEEVMHTEDKSAESTEEGPEEAVTKVEP
ncbi:hypothetical protein CAPTEDRAFT_220629, partial [Capitella teleta]